MVSLLNIQMSAIVMTYTQRPYSNPQVPQSANSLKLQKQLCVWGTRCGGTRYLFFFFI